MVRLYPRILDMDPQDVQMRLIDLKVHISRVQSSPTRPHRSTFPAATS